MLYTLIDKKEAVGEAWKEFFASEPNVTITTGDMLQIKCDAVVSPANSFGFMDGGLDLAISEQLGWHIEEELQHRIKELPKANCWWVKHWLLKPATATYHT